MENQSVYKITPYCMQIDMQAPLKPFEQSVREHEQ